MILALLLLSLQIASTANAAPRTVTFNKQVDAGRLRAELERASFQVDNLRCNGTACILELASAETKNPDSIISAHVYVDRAVARKQAIVSARALYAKLKAGTITSVEKDELLQRLVELLLDVQ